MNEPGTKQTIELTCGCGNSETFTGDSKARVETGAWRFKLVKKAPIDSQTYSLPVCPQCHLEERLKVELLGTPLTKEQVLKVALAAFEGVVELKDKWQKSVGKSHEQQDTRGDDHRRSRKS